MFLPGSEIPKWFRHQSSGSFITIKLPRHWYNATFIGFAFAVVVAFEENYHEDCSTFDMACSYSIKHKNGNRLFYSWNCGLPIDHKLNKPDHIVVGYSPCMNTRLLKGSYTNIRFKFRASKTLPGPRKVCTLKRCGVRPLYL